MTKRELLIVGGVLVLIACAVAVWMYEKPATKNAVEQASGSEQNPNAPGSSSGKTMCSQDAMQCADGTFVSRTPPDCRFVCPKVSATPVVPNAAGLLVVKIGETGKFSTGSGIEITPMGILEDSRCPVDVQCIQAGTVRLRTNVLTASGTSRTDFKLGETVSVGGQSVTLVTVIPEKNTKKPTTYADYVFTFEIKK